MIAQNPHDLISILKILQNEYHELEGNQEDKKQYYYEKRNLFNSREQGKIG